MQKHCDWLLLIDNVEEGIKVKDSLLGMQHGHVLLTSRSQAVAELAHNLRLDKMQPEEGAVGSDALDEGTRVTLLFSAKEAIFKCLYPVVGRRFYYEDARITSADLATGCFVAQLMTTLAPGFERGAILRGRFEIDDVRVHTGVWLEPHGR